MKRQQIELAISLTAAAVLSISFSQPGLAQNTAATTASAPSAAPTAAASAQVWQPDPKSAATLGTPTIVGIYTIRLPAGYSAVPTPAGMHAPAGVEYHAFTGAFNPDSSRPSLIIIVATPPPNEKIPPLNVVLEKFVAGKQRRWSSFTQTPAETGRIGGLTFERTYISGIASGPAGDPHPVKSFIYVSIDGDKVIEFSAEDAAQYSPTSLPRMEAAVLTLTRRM